MQATTTRSILAQSAFALFIAVYAFTSAANAAVINHGMFMGDEVAYIDVTETSADPVPIYGAPVVVPDNVLAFFEPASSNPSVGFNAQAGGGMADITDGFLNLTIMAKPARAIHSLDFSEGGDYTMAALGNALAQVSASLNVFQLSIVEVDNAPIAPVVLSGIDTTTLNLPGDPNAGAWELGLTFDLEQALNDANVAFGPGGGATKIIAKVNNTLTALSQPGSVAGIFKKDFNIVPWTVPEPTTLILAAFGLVGVLATRRAV